MVLVQIAGRKLRKELRAPLFSGLVPFSAFVLVQFLSLRFLGWKIIVGIA